MTLGGWIFMLGSLALTWTLAAWCFRRLLRAPRQRP